MNFKFFFLLLILLGCGVKGDPISPTGKPLPSLLDNYPDVKLEKTINENVKR